MQNGIAVTLQCKRSTKKTERVVSLLLTVIGNEPCKNRWIHRVVKDFKVGHNSIFCLTIEHCHSGQGIYRALQNHSCICYCMAEPKITTIPGEEALEEGFHIKLWVGHDACIEIEVVQPVVPVGHTNTWSYRIHFCAPKCFLFVFPT